MEVEVGVNASDGVSMAMDVKVGGYWFVASIIILTLPLP